MKKPPVTVLVLALLLMAAGAMGIVYHLGDFKPPQPFRMENVLILLVRLLAIVSGVFMLRQMNWARWLALAWIAFHFILSFFHSTQEVIMHGLILALFAWILFRADAKAWFGVSSPVRP